MKDVGSGFLPSVEFGFQDYLPRLASRKILSRTSASHEYLFGKRIHPMKQLLRNLRQTVVAGFFFLFPLYVVFIMISKAWTSLTSIGSRLASMFGVKTVLGVGGTTLFSSLLIIAIWLLCGLLVRVSFIGSFSRAVERTISSLIPSYASYRAIAEEKIAHKTKILPYASALLKQGDCRQPAFVVDKDDDGNFVLFLPGIPETGRGQVLVARADQVLLVPSLSANELDAILKKMGKGLLSECAKKREVA
jgi:hypothetical protein